VLDYVLGHQRLAQQLALALHTIEVEVEQPSLAVEEPAEAQNSALVLVVDLT
jgi:hypothetical protein